jgi:DNA modification methylase
VIRLITGDVLKSLAKLPDESVQCVVTSPPYWGLRDYGTATWTGGDPDCDHQAPTRQGQTGQRASRTFTANQPYRDICRKCGARRIDAQLGLEPTPEAFVANLVAVFAEVRRVLRPDGTCWVNLGDSFSSGGRQTQCQPSLRAGQSGVAIRPPVTSSLKPKDLVGIPWRVAFALQADGWYLRSDIVWHKPNPMPESVRDRPTKSHEYVFLLTKRARYYYDADAVREAGSGRNWLAAGGNLVGKGVHKCGDGYRDNGDGRTGEAFGRNSRSVWTITPKPFKGAHFATFPPALVERCVKAGSRPGDTVLDPFSGAGTVALVSQQLGRDAIGIELKPAYNRMARKRIAAAQARQTEAA